jgi:glycosyltransferase involved in cell wall biosynthesis
LACGSRTHLSIGFVPECNKITNVIYDHQIFSVQEYGGISRYFYEVAKRVNSSAGFSASVVAPLHVNRYLDGGGVDVKGIRIPSLRRGVRAMEAINHRIGSTLSRMSRPDVFHETYYPEASSAPKGCPVVVTVHDMIPERLSGVFGKNDETSVRKRAAVERADRVICVSESTRRDLMELFNPDPKKIQTIHLGATRAPPLDTAADSQKAHMIERPFFLYVGMRGPYKNFDRVLRAYASRQWLLTEFDLVVFGYAVFTPEEIELMASLGLEHPRVRQMTGNDSLLGQLYSRAVALVYPSLYEGFGIPPLEAMAHGCPVLCSNRSSIPEVVGDAGLYFEPESVDSIADAMERVAAVAEFRKDLSARGSERARQFSWDRCAARTMEVYRELVT